MCPDLVERLHGEVDAAAGRGQRKVLLWHSLHLCHDDIGLLYLPGHLSCLLLQVLQCGDDGVIIKDAAFNLIEGLQQGFLQLTQTQLELTYKRQEDSCSSAFSFHWTLFPPWLKSELYCIPVSVHHHPQLCPVIVLAHLLFSVSPCSLRRSERFSSTSGLSAFRTSLRHWLWRLLRVTVKFTNVTREHKSGGNSTCTHTHKRYHVTQINFEQSF